MTTRAAPIDSSREAAAGLTAELSDDVVHKLVLRLTLLLTLLHGPTMVALAVTVRLLAGLPLAFPRLLDLRLLWYVLAVVLLAGAFWDWQQNDNHDYLLAYWALACGLSLAAKHATAWLRHCAAVLLAVVFASAFLWKLIGSEYLDGSFLYFTLLSDGRLQPLASAISGTRIADLSLPMQAIAFLGTRGFEGVHVPVDAAPSLRVVALPLSWTVLLVEGCVAACFLAPAMRSRATAHWSLIAFIVLTYFVLPVFPFAFLLCVMGLAACDVGDSAMRRRYIVLLACLHVTLLPWQTLLVP